MTYCIVARDCTTGEIGLAQASHSTNVSAKTLAVASPDVRCLAICQSFSDLRVAHRALELVRAGERPSTALAAANAFIDGADFRQLLCVDLHGGIAVLSGERCVAETVKALSPDGDMGMAGNMLMSSSAAHAAIAAWESSPYDLTHRLMLVLRAVAETGGDVRGDRSASILIHGGPQPMDVRVVDSDDPLTVLRDRLSDALAGRAVAEARHWWMRDGHRGIEAPAELIAQLRNYAFTTTTVEALVWAMVSDPSLVLARDRRAQLAGEIAERLLDSRRQGS
ncbi:MAG: DUF1028 domain-containing protein [Acidimicrobiia bacterium]